jgi:hypothetical protein
MECIFRLHKSLEVHIEGKIVMNPYLISAILGGIVTVVVVVLIKELKSTAKEVGVAETVAKEEEHAHEEQIIGDTIVAIERDPGFASERLHAGDA